MTRDKALNRLEYKDWVLHDDEYLYTKDGAESVINEIYDDIEMKTCANCMWFSDAYEYFGKCDNERMGIKILCPTSDFGCNNFDKRKL